MSLQSNAVVAREGTVSLRATIPEGIVAYLGIRAGDILDWKMEIKDGKKIVTMIKLEQFSTDKATRIASKHAKIRKQK